MNTQQKIDKILLHKYWGLPIFIIFLGIMFFTTFVVGSYPVSWIEAFFRLLAEITDFLLSDGILKELINDGILSGVGLVASFLPNIMILFFFISIMEDSGYMARVAVMMDKTMKKLGLNGKSVVPLLMGFGCNVPAILAASAIENKRERIKTILLIPFMSCSARLPVYILITGILFSELIGVLVLSAVYLLGILLAISFALLFKHSKRLVEDEAETFNIDLPKYKLPTLKSILIKIWFKASDYIKKFYTTILIASVVIWVLGAFPRIETTKIDTETTTETTSNLKNQIEHSYIGKIGRTIEPILKPLGFDWRMSIALIMGISAKELAVSTLGVIFGIEVVDDAQLTGKNTPFAEQLRNATYISGEKKGQKIFTIPVGLAFMAFFLIYFPCVSAFIAIKKAAGKLAAAVIGMYATLAAYFVAFIVKVVSDFVCSI
jgi:ferrous iron transport protein B